MSSHSKLKIRNNGRQPNQLRDVKVTFNAFGYAAGSVLFEQGNTKVLCSVSMQNGVPPFLRGKGSGWLTAEYAMLPAATTVRTTREVSSVKRNGRSIEISRLIGRSLRTIVNLAAIGERTILIDCDVLQADGGTRAACITGACLALEVAQAQWRHDGLIKKTVMQDRIVGISVGVLDGHAILDPDFSEDSGIDADFNVILTQSDRLVEIQGGAEIAPIAWQQFDEIRMYARTGAQELLTFFQERIEAHLSSMAMDTSATTTRGKAPLFSIKNRQVSTPQ